jgi:UDP-N-acetylglucosamine 2-epimerase
MQNIPSTDPRALRCDIIVGTRPEAIKLAPVVKALRESGDDFLVRVVTSGQHGEICRSALAAFGLTADSALDIESISGSLADSAGNVLRAFGRRFAVSRPDLILVQGDTTTAMAAALAGFYAQIPVAHVEAGLRSGDLANPFPEEANRQKHRYISVPDPIIASALVPASATFIFIDCRKEAEVLLDPTLLTNVEIDTV